MKTITLISRNRAVPSQDEMKLLPLKEQMRITRLLVAQASLPMSSEANRCSECGAQEESRYRGIIVAHHEDYSLPMEVVMLCRSCHGKRHAVLGTKSASNARMERDKNSSKAERINITAPEGTKAALDHIGKPSFQSRSAVIMEMIEPMLAAIREELKRRQKLKTK